MRQRFSATSAARSSPARRCARTPGGSSRHLVVLVLGGFIVYATWAALQNAHYYAAPYLSPFYSPCLSQSCLQHVRTVCR